MRDEDRLKAVTRWAPVTWALAAANVSLFAGMALTQQRVFDFSSHCLLTWGGGLAPRVFGAGWWRAASHMFVHGDLAHLASNMLFLLLAGPFVERLLGPVRFALVYLFAGLGGGLLAMGTSPQHVVVGASAAVFGVYGALLGCCLGGPRSIPWRMVGQRAGVLLAYTAVSLLGDWLDFTRQPAAHLGGFVFGLAGGFLCGHKLRPRAARLPLGVVVAICVGILGLTALEVYNCLSRALECYREYASIKDRERELQGRFHDLMLRWEQNKLTSAECSRALQSRLIPSLQEMRAAHKLQLTGELAEMEKHSFSMQEFWKVLRSTRGKVLERDRGRLTLKEYGDAYRFLCKVRVDTWRALADELNSKHPSPARALLDNHELDMLISGLDDRLNEDNPLYRWFEMRRGNRRPAKEDGAGPERNLTKNPGFEGGLKGWTTYTVGPPSRFEFDTDVGHEGRQALRVTASQPTDTVCYQDVTLKPGRWYQFSGWVRTRGLVPLGARLWGTFSICHGGGNVLIAGAASHGGDTEWTQTSIRFRATGGGLTRIYVHFAGWGQARGTAWFDDLKLVEVDQRARKRPRATRPWPAARHAGHGAWQTMPDMPRCETNGGSWHPP